MARLAPCRRHSYLGPSCNPRQFRRWTRPTSVDPGTGDTLATGVTSVRHTVNIDGGDGGDQVVVNLTGNTDYIVNVQDSGVFTGDADTLTINGVPGDDTFLLRRNFVALLQYDNGVLQPTYERINYDTSIEALDVNGLEPFDFVYNDTSGEVEEVLAKDLAFTLDRSSVDYAAASAASQTNFYLDDNSAITVLTGADGGSSFHFGQVFGSDRVGGGTVQFGDEIRTVEVELGLDASGNPVTGYLTRGISFSTTAYDGAGDDQFFVYSNQASLKLYGEDGNDDFVVRAFALYTGGGVSTGDTTIHTGGGENQVTYNVNAPVSILDGGSGINTVTVLGSGFGDNFVITKDGVNGAGLNVSMTNVQVLEVDGVSGDNNFYVLSTAPGEVVTLIGGTGNNSFNVAGDVTGKVIAKSANGVAGIINHSVASADPAYNGIFVDGVPLNVATAQSGAVIVGQLTKVGDSATPVTQLFEDPSAGLNEAQYTLKMATPADTVAGTVAYITVSAALRPYNEAAQGSKSIEVSDDNGTTWHQSLVLKFDAGSSPASGTEWDRTQAILVKADQDTVAEGEQTIVISHSIRSSNATFNEAVIANLEVAILIDRTAAGWGWFVDATPFANREFPIALGNGVYAADPASPAYGHMDVLSTVLHELGNAMGFVEDTGQDVTGSILAAGVRRLPVAAASADAAPTAATNSLAAGLAQPLAAQAGRGGGLGQGLAAQDLAPGLIAVTANGVSAPEDPVTVSPPPPAVLGFAGLPESTIVVGPELLTQKPGFPADDFKGAFVSLGEPLAGPDAGPAAPAAPPASDDLPPAPPHHSDPRLPPSENPGTATIAWDNGGVGRFDAFGSDLAGGSQNWLNDFLNHLGQDEAQWNPNAGLRVRPNEPGATPNR
jgi:hypothetical protein